MKILTTALICAGLTLSVASASVTPAGAQDKPGVKVSHGLTLLGELKYAADFKHLDHVNPDAPKGGTLHRFSVGAFDTFNPYIIKGTPAAGIGQVYETLTTSPLDEISAGYGLIASSVEVPDDLSYTTFNLRPEARFHDGSPITADDVIWSFETLKKDGRPFYRFYYKDIARAVKLGPHKVKFEFSGPPNHELPHIVGQLTVMSKKWWSTRDFTKSTLERPMGSGPYRIGAFEPGRFVEIERVKDWWGAKLPINIGQNNFDRIRYDYYRDQTVALEAFKSGRYDIRNENASLTWATGYNFPARKAGRVKLEEVEHARPTGMQAFVFNIRREQFQDPVLRQAMAYAFDFEWSNKNLFYGQYARTSSYFSNSDLAATALPSKDELALLEPWRGKIPDEVFTKVYAPPATDGSGKIRKNLRTALRLLKKAGYKIENNKLISPKTGKAIALEVLLVSPAFERIVAPFAQNLKRLGIVANIRTVDQSQYINRLRSFDYDMIVGGAGQSESPGNEQRDYWSSTAADREGSQNVVGIKNPAIDALIEKIVNARDRQSLVTATRALDRVLLWNHYVIPQWHVRIDRLAYWNRFGISKHPKYGADVMSWWVDPAKDARIKNGHKDK
ncbi:MAG: microcin C transport system substrate-binding protein [Paracoccaceae bacterium]|jgi:microcin C transport system substrate-binding protein